MGDAVVGPGRPVLPLAEDFATEIAGLETRADISDYMVRLSSAYGFHYFFVGRLPSLDIEKIDDITVITNVPDALMAYYDRAGLIQGSLGFRKLRTTTTPFRMSIDEWRESATIAVPEGYADFMIEIGINEACYFPVHDAAGGRAVILMIGRKMELDIDGMTDLHMVFIHVYNRLTEIGTVDVKKDVVLSDREVQCLTWTAAGKTSAEIAGILGLSEHTVNHYLNHAAKKLDAVNRTQAVVIAIRRGFIT